MRRNWEPDLSREVEGAEGWYWEMDKRLGDGNVEAKPGLVARTIEIDLDSTNWR